jgi:hypothetical protein
MKSQIKLGSPPTDIILSISAYALKLNIYIIDFLDLYQHKEKKFNGGSTHKVYILSINKIEFYPLYFQLQKYI